MPQAVKVRSDIEVGCYAYEGVDAVKNSLRAGIALGTEETPIKINLIAPPRYVVTTTTLDREEGIALLQAALKSIEETIKKFDGIFTVINAVRSIDLCQYMVIFVCVSMYVLAQSRYRLGRRAVGQTT